MVVADPKNVVPIFKKNARLRLSDPAVAIAGEVAGELLAQEVDSIGDGVGHLRAFGRPPVFLYCGRVALIARFGLTKERNQDGHVRVTLDVVQNVRIDGNEDPGTEYMDFGTEAQDAFAGDGLDCDGNSRGMVGQERAMVQLDKDQLFTLP